MHRPSKKYDIRRYILVESPSYPHGKFVWSTEVIVSFNTIADCIEYLAFSDSVGIFDGKSLLAYSPTTPL